MSGVEQIIREAINSVLASHAGDRPCVTVKQAVEKAAAALATASQPDKRVEDMKERCAREVGLLARIARASPFWQNATADQLDQLESRVRALPTTSNERDSRHG